jgi:hypothetical protein
LHKVPKMMTELFQKDLSLIQIQEDLPLIWLKHFITRCCLQGEFVL